MSRTNFSLRTVIFVLMATFHVVNGVSRRISCNIFKTLGWIYGWLLPFYML
jgi:hypothetical protein